MSAVRVGEGWWGRSSWRCRESDSRRRRASERGTESEILFVSEGGEEGDGEEDEDVDEDGGEEGEEHEATEELGEGGGALAEDRRGIRSLRGVRPGWEG